MKTVLTVLTVGDIAKMAPLLQAAAISPGTLLSNLETVWAQMPALHRARYAEQFPEAVELIAGPPLTQDRYDQLLRELAHEMGVPPNLAGMRAHWGTLDEDAKAWLLFGHPLIGALVDSEERPPYEDPTVVPDHHSAPA
ncbi:MAG: hypothetical protein AAB691_01565 [Patescibacteria group bacterium]